MPLSTYLARRLLRGGRADKKGVRGLFITSGESVNYLGKKIGKSALVASLGVGTGAVILGQSLGVAGRGIREFTGEKLPEEKAEKNIELLQKETEARKRSFEEYMRELAVLEAKQRDPFFQASRLARAPWNTLVEDTPKRETQQPTWGMTDIGILLGLAAVIYAVVKK